MSMFRTSLLAAAIAAAVVGSAVAGTFDVKTPDVTKGETEVGLNSTFFSRHPAFADPLRTSLELSAGYTPTDSFKFGAKVAFDREVGSRLHAVTAGIEGLKVVRKLEQGFGFGLFGSLDGALRRDQTNAVTFGPVLQFGTETTWLAVNPFLVRSFGRNRTEGVDFSYGWQARHQLREGFGVGIEGFGVVPSIADSPGRDGQEHRIGPVVYLARDLSRDGRDSKISAEFGVFRGLTGGTQDWAVKAKAGLTF